ncbi:exodeoxyribonuclease V subunit gamma [Basfia succiniciproducens]|uniref:RecBCD enzyme subunit RecC n=1 Tax=Basfia succiniciproducens TaxID=653940 RepID=A0A1G5BWS3_9PAST|nr:exodeoxyribonuclease V subunit gamma [Basfia succiniciproducens]QIM68160.1 exodeoxyribonuclease V subunit gamma [Basfia succiniciproducens]SCX94699.1 DNA helicase/exodeoxyribonuclease V, gamma subunit [Basfia succiniciproducens]
MFTVYHSNRLDVQKDILIELMQLLPPDDPFQTEIILVQSPGMAQWLQLKIAEKKGIAANLKFPMPASFIWQQYINVLEDVSQQTQFNKDAMTWRLMQLIPQFLSEPCFQALENYLKNSPYSEQQKLYQLARKVADLFDQYLVYRPNWIQAWENNQPESIEQAIGTYQKDDNPELITQIKRDIKWQGILWRALIDEVQRGAGYKVRHRANLHQAFIDKLRSAKPENLPQRIFIFGISALPQSYLETFEAMSRYCDIHLFFNNPSREYWGDIVDDRFLQKLQTRQRFDHYENNHTALLSSATLTNMQQENYEFSPDNEKLLVGNPLLAGWGKLGRDFFYLLTDLMTRAEEHNREIIAFVDLDDKTLLSQVQGHILDLIPMAVKKLNKPQEDNSLTIHACHSVMREVEVLHDYLLSLFELDKNLTPKDIVVMVADIDKYAPYIQAVFGQYQKDLQTNQFYQADKRYIPFSISDNKLTESDVLIASFLMLLNLKESQFSAEEVLAYLDIPAIRMRFQIELEDLETIREWVKNSGIRFGLEKRTDNSLKNYNAWQSGLERMLLGYAMRAENGIWQDSLGFDDSHGLQGKLAGLLAAFIERLYQWQQFLRNPHSYEEWGQALLELVDHFFLENEQSLEAILYLKEIIQQLHEQLDEVNFTSKLEIDVIAEVMAEQLNDKNTSLKFLVGKVSFCTLLPMRAIPFKAVCLLGMNDGEYPRQQTPNSFDLMQYHRQKGDRFRRDDDRYLFLEALLAAENYFYVSYVGQSIIDNQQREPSVLVSQLLDYLAENLANNDEEIEQIRTSLVQYHSMTIFSPDNFSAMHRSYAKEWLPLVNRNQYPVPDFTQQISGEIDEVREIDILQLVQFVQHPVKFFFEKRLGVYFQQTDEQIPETENFTLDNLDNFLIKDELIRFADDETDNYFERLKLEGILPYGHFGDIYKRRLQNEAAELKNKISAYLSQEPAHQFVEITLDMGEQSVLLTGHLDHLYQPFAQRVKWRVGEVKDKHIIENWLYYLLQLCTTDNVNPPLYYGKNGCIGFKTLEKSTALSILKLYVKAYLQGLKQVQIVPTYKIDDYLKSCQPETEFDTLSAFNNLRDLFKSSNNYTNEKEDIYWTRVFQQATELNSDKEKLMQIQQTTRDWFGLMLNSVEKVKL